MLKVTKNGITYKVSKGGTLVNLYNENGFNYDCFTSSDPINSTKELEKEVINLLWLTKTDSLYSDIMEILQDNDVSLEGFKVSKIINVIQKHAGNREKHVVYNLKKMEISGINHKVITFISNDFKSFDISLEKMEITG